MYQTKTIKVSSFANLVKLLLKLCKLPNKERPKQLINTELLMCFLNRLIRAGFLSEENGMNVNVKLLLFVNSTATLNFYLAAYLVYSLIHYKKIAIINYMKYV